MRKNRILLYALSFLQGLVFYSSVATLYRQAAGLTLLEISLIESVSYLLCLALEAPWGVVAERVGYKRTMLIGCAVLALSKVVFYRAESFSGFLLERVLLSVAISGLSGVDESVLYLSCEEGRSQRCFGLYAALGNAGLLTATVVFALTGASDFRRAAAWTAIAYGAAVLVCLPLREVKKPDATARRRGLLRRVLRETLRNRALLLLLATSTLFSCTAQTVTVFLNQPQYVRCGLNAAAISLLYLPTTLLTLCGALSDRLTRRLGARRMGLSALLLAAALCLTLALTRSAALSVAAILCLQCVSSLFGPLQTELENRMIAPDFRAAALSVNAMLSDGVAAGINAAFGALSDASLPAALAFGCALCLAGAALLNAALREGGKG